MYKICCEEGVCIMVQDFSRNRDVFYQFEIKSSYWTRKQITMHPTVIHLFGDGKWHRIVITHLSDITKHDAHFVHYITKDCIEYLTNHYPEIKLQKVIIWSDGCASQYKGKISFFYLNQLQAIFPSLEIQRNYYGSEHGKGESDAETGIFSKQIMDAVKSEKNVLSNASEMCDFLRENNQDYRIFKHVTEDDLKDIHDTFKGVIINTLSGKCTRSLHQIKSDNRQGFLLTRKSSCFCKSCTAGTFSKCENISFTLGNFKPRILPTNIPGDESIDIDDEDESENNYMHDDVEQIQIQQE